MHNTAFWLWVEKWKQWHLLIEKLAAYGFEYSSLQVLQYYLLSRKQSTKINDAYSKYCEMLFAILQGPILGPL